MEDRPQAGSYNILSNRFREIFVAVRPLSARAAGNGAAKFQRRQIVAGVG